MKRSASSSRLFPYPTLFRSTAVFTSDAATELGMRFYPLEKIVFASDCPFDPEKGTMYIRETIRILDALDLTKQQRNQRSEEHTSELQSPCNIVCRLLLEKKK